MTRQRIRGSKDLPFSCLPSHLPTFMRRMSYRRDVIVSRLEVSARKSRRIMISNGLSSIDRAVANLWGSCACITRTQEGFPENIWRVRPGAMFPLMMTFTFIHLASKLGSSAKVSMLIYLTYSASCVRDHAQEGCRNHCNECRSSLGDHLKKNPVDFTNPERLQKVS